MKFIIKVSSSFVLVFFFLLYNVYGQNISFEKSESFYPHIERLQKEAITWGHLSVPENWDVPNGKQVKIAVSILKNKAGTDKADAIVFIQGGPGAGGIQTIWSWLNHAIRDKNDIILFDVRGTGFSEPRLCPDLGKKLMKILAENQTEKEDEDDKVAVAMTCKQELLNKNIDIEAYHSLSIAKDLNALKTQLGYSKWHAYSASYGTYINQVYASTFPTDIKSLILDSSISDISKYYTQNTENYIKGLSIVFDKCKKSTSCNNQYPDLEKVFYQTIADLETNPITVEVDKNIIEAGSFTYNTEDFKIAIHQALYHRQLVEVMPLLIYEFHNRNKAALANLVAAFSSLLAMDYGVYYCVSCNEVLPNNAFGKFNNNANQFKKLSGGISFYKSDFTVCDKWNENSIDTTSLQHSISNLKELDIPVLVFGGEYDPITPPSNGEELSETLPNAHFVMANTFGHAPSFSRTGSKLTTAFINNTSQQPNVLAFSKIPEINFAKGIKINGGISSMGNSLGQMDPIFLTPLLIALFLMIMFIVIHLAKFFKGKYVLLPDKIIRGGSMLTSIIGISCLVGFIMALSKVANSNAFVLAFGLPESYTYLFWALFTFITLLVLSLIYFLINIKKINGRSIVFSVLFSQLVFAIYFLYWGII